jgi:hypothetical protein
MSVLRIRDVYPVAGSNFFFISDPNCFHPVSLSASKNLIILTQKIVFKTPENMIRVVHPGSGARIQILSFYTSRMTGQGVTNPGSAH